MASLIHSLPGRETLASPSTSYPESLVDHALELKLDEDPYWRLILHYRPRWIHGVKSEIDAAGFFNAKDGRMNPRSELVETIRGFFAPLPQDPATQHPQCLFIDRYRWLKSKLGFDPSKLPEQPCKEYDEWRKALDPESVTLVFSSYYMSNPSSAFGHTLLRLNHRKHSSSERLLDYGVNYAANPTTSNPLAYGILGMTGGFPGAFSNVLYFLKVEEYNSHESRELWEYDLDLSAEQIDRMMLHLWTVGHFPSSYYFFDKNCSFMLMALLDSAKPELRLSEQFDTWWVIPADTVRAVVRRPGLVRNVTVRPSLAYRIKTHRRNFSPDEESRFFELIGHPEVREARLGDLKKPPSAEAVRTLDAILDYLRYRKAKGGNKLAAEDAAFQSQVLLTRSDYPDQTPEISFSKEEITAQRPDAGHDSRTFTLATGYQGANGSFVELGIRPAFHDLNAVPIGYPKGAQIEVMQLQARYSPRPALLRVERFNLLQLISLSPWDRIFRRFSWSARLGADPVRDVSCRDCLEYKGNLGAGVAWDLAQPLFVYGLAKAELAFGGDYTPGYRLGPGGEAGLLIAMSDQMSFQLGANYHHPIMGYRPSYFEGGAEVRFSPSMNSDLRFRYDAYPTTSQGKFSLNVYY